MTVSYTRKIVIKRIEARGTFDDELQHQFIYMELEENECAIHPFVDCVRLPKELNHFRLEKKVGKMDA